MTPLELAKNENLLVRYLTRFRVGKFPCSLGVDMVDAIRQNSLSGAEVVPLFEMFISGGLGWDVANYSPFDVVSGALVVRSGPRL